MKEPDRVATRIDYPPTKNEVDELGQNGSATYVNWFGSWSDAIDAVDCSVSRNFDISAATPKEDLCRVVDQPGKPPSVAEARELLEYPVSTYEREFRPLNDAHPAVVYEVNQHEMVPNEDLLRNLQKLASELGSPPTVVPNRLHSEYSFNAYQNNFESWNEALSSAGLKRNSEYWIPRSNLLKEVHRLRDELGHTPTSVEMSSRGEYSLMPNVDEFGSWSNGLQGAGLTPWAARLIKTNPIYGVGWTEKLKERIRDRDGRKYTVCEWTNGPLENGSIGVSPSIIIYGAALR